MKKVLIVDDQQGMLDNLSEVLRDENYIVDTAGDGEDALEKLENNRFDCLILDINLPRMDGLTVLKKIKEAGDETPVLIFTAFGSSEKTIEAMKLGAFDYLEKPFDLEELILLVQRAVRYTEMVDELHTLKERINRGDGPEGAFVGTSQKMREIFKLIGKVAHSDATVLIQGESGTGKELIADAIHRHSSRSTAPFIKVNCAAIPVNLLETELFGHEKGAFTDATSMKKGRFELAEKGTILLDEIGDISLELQSKLLRVLQNRTFERIGGKETLRCEARIIASTNRDLRGAIREGRFREDLFYRLNVVTIHVPPLRERHEDIPLLIDHFLEKYSSDTANSAAITDSALEVLLKHQWTGNVRELENVIQRALVLSDGNFITRENLTFLDSTGYQATVDDSRAGSLPMKKMVADLERDLVITALKKCNGNRSKAAEMLGINRRVLFNKIKDLDIRE